MGTNQGFLVFAIMFGVIFFMSMPVIAVPAAIVLLFMWLIVIMSNRKWDQIDEKMTDMAISGEAKEKPAEFMTHGCAGATLGYLIVFMFIGLVVLAVIGAELQKGM